MIIQKENMQYKRKGDVIMAVKKTGLGKGLEALFSENQLTKEEEKKIKDGEEIVQKIKVIEIEPNRNQPRRNFPSESIEELAKSIEKYGVIQPIIVSKKDGYYEIVAGERRWRAAKKAGLKEMPCIVRENDERKNKEIALIENIQREDLNPIDKARGFRQLLDDYGMTQQQLADTIGLNRSTVTNTLRLLNLDERVMQLAIDGKLNEGHCRSLLCITDPDKQYAAAIRIIEKGETVRDIEKKGGTILLETPAQKLIQNDKGEVIGVEAKNYKGEKVVVKAKAVILATGGFPGNQEMLKKYVPDIGKEGMARIMLRGPGIEGRTGDGINMAKAIGADLAGMDTIAGNSPYLEYEPVIFQFNGPQWLKESRAALSQPFLWVNKFGQRSL